MRILADETFPGDAVAALRERGHDVAWVHADAPGSSDLQILTRAQAEERILVTVDKPFGEWASVRVFPLRAAWCCFGSQCRQLRTLRGLPWQRWKAGQIGRDTLRLLRMIEFESHLFLDSHTV